MRSWPIGPRPGKVLSDFTLEGELIKEINLLISSPTFAIQIGVDGKGVVSQPAEIPARSGIWRVVGRSHLANATTIPSVFEVNTHSTDTIARAFWETPRGWCDTSARAQLLAWMERSEADLFPCRFETSIPLGSGLSSN